jgi:hypothetical protein
MTTWTVKEDEFGAHHIVFSDGREHLLIVRYDAGDVDNPYNADTMWSALYDFYQCNEHIKDGDVFETKYGRFRCRGVHVVNG